jgi:hypothetical protein
VALDIQDGKFFQAFDASNVLFQSVDPQATAASCFTDRLENR